MSNSPVRRREIVQSVGGVHVLISPLVKLPEEVLALDYPAASVSQVALDIRRVVIQKLLRSARFDLPIVQVVVE